MSLVADYIIRKEFAFMATAGNPWWHNPGNTLGPPFAAYIGNETRRHNIRVRKHNRFTRKVMTDPALTNRTYDLDRYVQDQIIVNEVSCQEVSEAVMRHFPTLSKKDQIKFDNWNLAKNGTEIKYEQTFFQKLQNQGTIVVVPKDKPVPKKSPGGKDGTPPLASISQIVESGCFSSPIPAPVYTVGVAPPNYRYAPPSTAKSFDSPWGSIFGFIITAGIIYAGFAVKNRIETGSFFRKAMSEIEILTAYQDKSLSLRQARILLIHNYQMTYSLATEFLTDSREKIN